MLFKNAFFIDELQMEIRSQQSYSEGWVALFVNFDDKCIEFDDFLVKQETLLAAAASN